jgi:hypothetical protein
MILASLRIVSLALAGLVLVSCASRAPTPWTHSARSVEEQSADRSDCRQRSTFQVEREVQRESPFMAEQRIEVQRLFDRDDAARRQKELYDSCMRDKGYVPVVLDR